MNDWLIDSNFFLHCHYHVDIWKTLFYELQSTDENILNHSENEIVELLLYMVVRNSISNKTV